MNYQRSITVNLPFAETIVRTREALTKQGFGVLTEIDVQATMHEKRGFNMEPYLILGACNPDLAYRALEIDRSIGVLLPCNVVISGSGQSSKVQILDPQIMASVTELPALQSVADEASTRLQLVLDNLSTL